jgi:hypothetical protein
MTAPSGLILTTSTERGAAAESPVFARTVGVNKLSNGVPNETGLCKRFKDHERSVVQADPAYAYGLSSNSILQLCEQK